MTTGRQVTTIYEVTETVFDEREWGYTTSTRVSRGLFATHAGAVAEMDTLTSRSSVGSVCITPRELRQ